MAESKVPKGYFQYHVSYHATTDSFGQVYVPVDVINPFNDVFVIRTVTGAWLARQLIDDSLAQPTLVLQFTDWQGNAASSKSVWIYFSK